MLSFLHQWTRCVLQQHGIMPNPIVDRPTLRLRPHHRHGFVRGRRGGGIIPSVRRLLACCSAHMRGMGHMPGWHIVSWPWHLPLVVFTDTLKPSI